MEKNIVYLNGKYLAEKKATVSITDRGFIFADGIYEVIPVYNGKTFAADRHIQRLYQSLQEINLNIPLTTEAWAEIFAELSKKNKIARGNYYFYIQITRGPANKRSHAFPSEVTPTILVSLNKSSKNLSFKSLCSGRSAITTSDSRWHKCNIKSIALLANVLHTQQAKDAEVDEVILIRDSHALEGASSNLFIVKNNTIITPPLSPAILPGITRQIILELAEQNEIAHSEKNISELELMHADEVWVTSSTREIYPIVKINNQPIGTGTVGPMWQTMIQLYKKQMANGENM